MLFIQKYDETVLPEDFHYINNICAILYDQIVDVYRYSDYEKFTTQKIDFSGKFSKEDLEDIKSEDDLVKFLLDNNLRRELNDTITKKICSAVISDFSNFVYEAISSAQKCKTTVAFALLRKPFTDELTILERLLVDPNGFIENFYIEGDISKYDPSSDRGKNKIDHFKLIDDCKKKMKYNLLIFSSLVYDIRYDKSFKGAIQELTNKSIHVVTNHRHYQTEAKDLNFIFDAVSNVDQYLHAFYTNCYYLLLYSASVIDELYFRYLTDHEHKTLRKSKALRRLISMVLVRDFREDESNINILEIILSIFEKNKITCSRCNFEFTPTGTDLEYYFFEENIKCPQCLDYTINSDKELESFVSRFEIILNVKNTE
ncbi:hypothetical protein FHS59_002591 [Algoriphagus iocasae]|uniref:Uncharacterized protein n=1 Tax=Algoriphagus iocasae TaxID=1836499 RepID=A0A841MJ98_9BACT|nr:hypothetical protein [Algoriphagus iocasae]MBB6326963.1 hypothetical protein [Algoriphagus iocasae]